jgi:hypothetical protein
MRFRAIMGKYRCLVAVFVYAALTCNNVSGKPLKSEPANPFGTSYDYSVGVASNDENGDDLR